MLKTENLSFKYENGNSFLFPDINTQDGGITLVLGKSGIGKSTLLHLLAGLMPPHTGNIWVNQEDISQMKGSNLDQYRGKNIGIIFQQNHFISSLSVLENLLLAQSLAGNEVNSKKCLNTLKQLNIEEKANKKTNQLSQGERQRAAIARALVNSPSLILADEPTSALDDENCEIVIDLLSHIAKQNNSALVVVTHDGRLKSKELDTIVLH